MAMIEDNSEMWVRGVSLISISRYVSSRLDEEKLKSFFDRFPEGEPDIILNANKSDWYPFRLQQHLREQVVREFNPENPEQAITDMVEITANYEISTFLRIVLGHLPVKLVLSRTADLWDKYYRPGRMDLVQFEKDFAAFEVRGFEHDRLFCPTMKAWLTIAAQNMNAESITVTETSCIHDGDPLCRWEVRWKMKS